MKTSTKRAAKEPKPLPDVRDFLRVLSRDMEKAQGKVHQVAKVLDDLPDAVNDITLENFLFQVRLLSEQLAVITGSGLYLRWDAARGTRK